MDWNWPCRESRVAGSAPRAWTARPRRVWSSSPAPQAPEGRARWTLRLLSEKLVELEIVAHRGPRDRPAGPKKTPSNPGAVRCGASRRGQDGAFVCQMESVLVGLQAPLRSEAAAWCAWTRPPSSACARCVKPDPGQRPKHPANATTASTRETASAHLMLFYAPLQNWRHVHVDRHPRRGAAGPHVRAPPARRASIPEAEQRDPGDGQPVHPRRLLALQERSSRRTRRRCSIGSSSCSPRSTAAG